MALRETVKIIFDIIHDLANTPNGVSRGEIVTKYRIGASTAHKYIRLIEDMGLPIYTEGQRYFIDESYFVELKLTSEEGEFLFLALERALTTHTRQSWSARSLINKLALKLHPHLAGELQDQFRSEQSNTTEARIFTTLAQAKRHRREIWVDYLPLNRSEASRWRIRPYRFISNPLSDGFYVLCDGSRDGEAYISLSLKFDRIQDVRLTDERFAIVDLARFQSHYGQSWGVWSSEGEPVSVVLRFEPRHYDRLLESTWHPTQSIRRDADGYVVFRVKVSAPQEMTPWIRSWGSGVVVEEPPELRQRLMRSLMRQVRNYGMTLEKDEDVKSLIHLLWAKREPRGKPKAETTAYHLLTYHLLDVAAVACRMWDDVLSAAQKTRLQELLGLDAEATRQLLALLAGLHDIGKATPGFQKKVADLYEALCEADEDLREHSYIDDHGILSAVILQRWLKDEMSVKKMRAGQLAAVIGGHHGAWISSNERQQAQASIGKEKWKTLQKELIAQLQATLGVDEISLPEDPQAFNVFAAFLSGFVSVCDWVGSDAQYFALDEGIRDAQDYFRDSLEKASAALIGKGFIGWEADGSKPTFCEAFSYLGHEDQNFEANEMQRVGIDKLSDFTEAPRLILVEYLTGGGKTELALHIGDLLVNRFDLAGGYIAMPTQATSNQMFERVGEYLQRRYPKKSINFHLIHGQSDQQKPYQEIQPQPEREGNESGLSAEDWFQRNSKYALLAPFGVGTIDQAMLSVLQAKHHFVRQYALSQKLVIFDEIHSYDTYMNVIIERLLGWLRALGTPMILLSATLARQNRQALLEAVGATDTGDALAIPYPRLTVVAQDGNVAAHPLPRPETRAIAIEAIPPDDGSLLDAILPSYRQGGCIAIVCNTVNESICVARFLREEAAGIDKDDVWLFHARFPPVWRKDREDEVLAAFGKDAKEGERPERKILVATQIIEQSLDLDFDLMISRTAPIDLLIQRVGRLHRHPRKRPADLEDPILLLRQPDMDDDGIPDFDVDEFVYARFFLLKSWLKLREMSVLRSPDDVDELMDFVYSEGVEIDGINEAYREALAASYSKLALDDTNSEFRGKQYVIGVPSDEEMIDSNTFRLEDDLEKYVSTRDTQPAVDIICIIDPNLEERSQQPSKDDVEELLNYKVTVRGRRIKELLENHLPVNRMWERKPQLKFARPITFDGEYYIVPYSPITLRLTREYGLEIINEEKT